MTFLFAFFSFALFFCVFVSSTTGGKSSRNPIYPIFGSERSAFISADRDCLNRKFILWCILYGRPWESLNDVGLKMLIAEFAPNYIGTTPVKSTLGKFHPEILRK